jgi:hypothetical protein
MSSAASISAAKRRRGPQSSMQTAPQNTRGRQSQSNQPRSASSQPQSQGQRVNPMAILQNHELRLREIESKPNEADAHANTNSYVPQSPSTQVDNSRVEELERSNRDMYTKIEIMKTKIISLESQVIDLSKLKEIVFTLQTAVMRNSQKVETINTSSVTEVIKKDVVQEVSEELEDVTINIAAPTVSYGEENHEKGNVTFTVVDNAEKEQESESEK